MRFTLNSNHTSGKTGTNAVASVAVIAVTALLLVGANPAAAQTPFSFSTGDPDGKIATASRPESPGKIEIESADDFILGASTQITSATFTGVLVGGDVADIGNVDVEIYRVFPKDSDTVRTPNVPTRANSPSDVVFDTRDAAGGGLSFTTDLLSASFTAQNSVLNGIHGLPNPTTGGEGAVTGTEVRFNIVFNTAFGLPADHYFFIPQVEMANGNFMWLSAPKPIVAPGTPFSPDLQSWIRDANLDPDWVRIGTDVVGGSPAPTFNATFSLVGVSAPEPGAGAFLGGALLPLCLFLRRKR